VDVCELVVCIPNVNVNVRTTFPMFINTIFTYRPMENARHTNEIESSDARIDRLERMVELLAESLRQQQSQHLPLPPLPPIQVEPNNNDVIIALT